MNNKIELKIAKYVADKVAKRYGLDGKYSIVDDDTPFVDFDAIVKGSISIYIGLQVDTENTSGAKIIVTIDSREASDQSTVLFGYDEFDVRDPNLINNMFRFIDKELSRQL